jgi:hypothetical protein
MHEEMEMLPTDASILSVSCLLYNIARGSGHLIRLEGIQNPRRYDPASRALLISR